MKTKKYRCIKTMLMDTDNSESATLNKEYVVQAFDHGVPYQFLDNQGHEHLMTERDMKEYFVQVPFIFTENTKEEQRRFMLMIDVLFSMGIKDYQLWPICLLSMLYAFEMWKDGAEWDYVTSIMNDAHPNKESLIHQLQNTFGYPKEK